MIARLLRLKNFALTEKQSFPVLWAAAATTSAPVDAELDITSVKGSTVNLAPVAPQKAVFYANMELRATLGDRPVGVVNHTSWHVDDPYAAPLISKARSEWPTEEEAHTTRPGQLQLHVPRFEYQQDGDRWIEITINNVDDRGHPFHLVRAIATKTNIELTSVSARAQFLRPGSTRLPHSSGTTVQSVRIGQPSRHIEKPIEPHSQGHGVDPPNGLRSHPV